MAKMELESRLAILETEMHGEMEGRLSSLEKWRTELERNIWRVIMAAIGLGCMGYIHMIASKLGL